MRKLLIIFVSVLLIFLVCYTIFWFWAMHSITAEINNRYADKNIDISNIAVKFSSNENNYKFSSSSKSLNTLKLEKVEPYGFPFKFAIKAIGITQDTDKTHITLHSPLLIGYDIIKKNVFISYVGDCTSNYIDNSIMLGVLAKIANLSITAQWDLNSSLPGLLSNKKSKKLIPNLIKQLSNINVATNDIKIYALNTNEILYDEDHTNIDLFIENSNDDNIQIPQRIDIFVDNKFNNAKTLPDLLIYGYPEVIDFDMNNAVVKMSIYLQTASKSFDNIEDLEIGITDAHFASAQDDFNLTGLFKTNSINDMQLQINFDFQPKSGYFKMLITDYIKYLLTQKQLDNIGFITFNDIDLDSVFHALQNLESNKYNFELDVSFTSDKDRISFDLKNISLFTDQIGLRLSNHTVIPATANLYDWNTSGILAIHNYPIIVDEVTRYIYSTNGIYKDSIPETDILSKSTKTFLRLISDHPNSNSHDISFEYDIHGLNIPLGKIGSTKIGEFLVTYYVSLYKELMSTKNPKIEFEAMKQIFPNLAKAMDKIPLKNDNLLKSLLQ